MTPSRGVPPFDAAAATGPAPVEQPFLRHLVVAVGKLASSDRLTQVALGTGLFFALAYLAGASSWIETPPFFRLAIATLATFLPFAALIGPVPEDERDRAFWRMILWSVIALWLVTLMRLIQGSSTPESWQGPTLVAALAAELLRSALLVLILLAIAIRPHDPSRQRVAEVERSLRLPTVLVFTVGWLIYTAAVPTLLDGDLVRQREILTLALQPLHAYAVISLLAHSLFPIRFRWRATYFLFGLALATYTLSALRLIQTATAHNLAFFAEIIACLLTVLALRVRLWRFPAEQLPPEPPRNEEMRRNPGNLTLLLAAMLPLGHLAGYRLQLFEASLREAREAVVVFWMLALAILAAIQHRVAQRFVAELLAERRRVEMVLTRHERDFVVATERRNNDLALRRQNERFARAFHASPYGLMITSTDQGTLIEVNHLFLTRLGLSRKEEVLGKTTLQLGMWAEPTERQRFVSLLAAEGRVDGFTLTFRRNDGELHRALVSAVRLDLQDRPCFLTVGRDLTEEAREAERRLQVFATLEDSSIPFAAIGEGLSVAFWNQAMAEWIGLDAPTTTELGLYRVFGAELTAGILTRPALARFPAPPRHTTPDAPRPDSENHPRMAWIAAVESWQFGDAVLVFFPPSSPADPP